MSKDTEKSIEDMFAEAEKYFTEYDKQHERTKTRKITWK